MDLYFIYKNVLGKTEKSLRCIDIMYLIKMSKKASNPNKKPLILRILVLTLCALMVLGLVASAVAGMAF